MPTTLKDVAARAGVSPIVVSHVLNHKAKSVRVSAATADRVRQAAAELGYRLNVAASNFRSRRTMMIGVLHGIGFSRPQFDSGSRYFAQLMDGIVTGAFKHGYSVTLCPQLLGQTPEDAMSDGRFDGLVWYSSVPSEENERMLLRCSVPLVVIHGHAVRFRNRFPTVICDNMLGIELAVDHLIGLGHREIAFATQEGAVFLEAQERVESFVHWMAQKGLPRSPRDVINAGWDAAGMGRYFDEGLRHTAIIAHSDWLAADLLNLAAQRGIRVPEELSVIGFDSTSFCNELRPALTSISQPLAEIGEAAIDQLIHVIGGELCDPLEIIIPCGLDIRDSTLSIPKKESYP